MLNLVSSYVYEKSAFVSMHYSHLKRLKVGRSAQISALQWSSTNTREQIQRLGTNDRMTHTSKTQITKARLLLCTAIVQIKARNRGRTLDTA